MKLKKLDVSFYDDHTHLVQALDNHEGSWNRSKTRGYGFVILNINQLTFGIPLRSHIKHKASYLTHREKTQTPSLGIIGKGLDFSKALLISDPKYISSEIYKIPDEEYTKLIGKEHYICDRFNKYVNKYIHAIQRQDINILNDLEYRFTTLQNYHRELGLENT